MKKKLVLPKLRISTKAANSISSPFSAKRTNTPQNLSPYSTTSLDGRSTSRPAAKKKSRFGLVRTTFSRKSINFPNNNNNNNEAKAKCESPRKFSTISTVSTMLP